MLYHIPPVAMVGWPVDLVGRLRSAFPGLIVGMKDSSGDFEHTKSMIDAFPGFAVFPGAEVYLLAALKAGAAGCVSASANINARGIRYLIDHWRDADAPRQQEALNAVRKAVESRVMIPALKTVLAARYHDQQWLALRPPLTRLPEDQRRDLLADPAIAGLLEAVAA
jgi:4-hydroxy-tetrahydrodipicolinate synthase